MTRKKNQKHRKTVTSKTHKAPPQKTFPYEYMLLGLLIIITFFTYRSSLDNPFMTVWDDQMHITENPLVIASDGWHLLEFFIPNTQHLYHPLTMLSFALEYKLAGPDASVFHFTNIFLHLCNILLAFWFVQLLTRRKDIALIVAFFFALHPMQVEVVAWISERKDLLYGFFYLSALIAYLKFSERNRWKFYLFSLLLFTCSLLSKPTAVTLPVVLLLVDYFRGRRFTKTTLLEKLPFFLLAILAGLVPLLFQKASGDLTDMSISYTLLDRLFMASYALGFYIVKFLAPVNLSMMYYLPVKTDGLLPVLYYLSPVFVVALAWSLYATYRKYKEIFFGILFFAVTISPMIQLIPIARVITADRYVYVSFIGLALIVGYFYSRYSGKKLIRSLFFIAFAGYGILFIVLSVSRIAVWKDGVALFTDAVDRNPEFPHAWAARAGVKMKLHDYHGAISDYKEAVRLKITNAEAWNNCGACYYNLDQFDEAIPWFDKAIEMNPSYSMAYYNRARSLEKTGADEEKVLAGYSQAIRMDSSLVVAYNSRGYVRWRGADLDGAMEDCERVIALDPTQPEAWHLRGVIRFTQKRYEEALLDYDQAIRINPNYAEALYNRGVAKYYMGDGGGACADWQAASERNSSVAERMLEQLCK